MMGDLLVFIADLNELAEDDLLPVAMDYTQNLGPRVRSGALAMPEVDDWVKVHSDDDDTLYWAQVVRQVSERDLVVRIMWESCAPVINREWSAREYAVRDSATTPSAAFA